MDIKIINVMEKEIKYCICSWSWNNNPVDLKDLSLSEAQDYCHDFGIDPKDIKIQK